MEIHFIECMESFCICNANGLYKIIIISCHHSKVRVALSPKLGMGPGNETKLELLDIKKTKKKQKNIIFVSCSLIKIPFLILNNSNSGCCLVCSLYVHACTYNNYGYAKLVELQWHKKLMFNTVHKVLRNALFFFDTLLLLSLFKGFYIHTNNSICICKQ